MRSFKRFIAEGLHPTDNPKFRKWFRGSKVKDTEGNPLIVYHGSGNRIEEFSYEFTGKGNDQVGSGFYFTTDETEARGYAHDQKDGFDTPNPTVHACYLCIKKPLDSEAIGSVSYDKIRRMIAVSPKLDDTLWNWGDLGSESKQSIIARAAENYVIDKENIVRGLFNLANDFYDGEVKKFNRQVYFFLGYDGVVVNHPNGTTHYMAFFPSQIKSVDAVKFNQESDNIYD